MTEPQGPPGPPTYGNPYPPQPRGQYPTQYPQQYYYPPQYYARPPKPSFPHDRPRPYHQMLRTWDYHWWKPLVGVFAVLIGFVIVSPVVMLPILIIGAANQPGDFLDNFERMASLEEITPAGMLYLNASIAGAILVTWVIIRVLHGMRPRWLASVMPKLRWNFLMACLGVAVAAIVASFAVGALLPSSPSDTDLGSLNDFTSTTAWLTLIILLTTPFQGAGEEYVFRGYLLQAIGAFVEKPWWRWATITITAFLFACAHLQFDPPVFFDRFAFGFVAAWLAIRTGGLEAGIALHALNNYVAFGLALAFGDISDSLNDPTASWWAMIATLTQSVVYAALVVWVAKKMKVQTTTSPPNSVIEARA